MQESLVDNLHAAAHQLWQALPCLSLGLFESCGLTLTYRQCDTIPISNVF